MRASKFKIINWPLFTPAGFVVSQQLQLGRSSPGPCRAATHPPAGRIARVFRAKNLLLRRDRKLPDRAP